MAAVFPYFFRQKAAEGEIYKMRKSAHKKRGLFAECCEKWNKKEFCNTIMRRRKVRENSSKKEFLYTTHARGEKCKNAQKCTPKKEINDTV